MQAIKNYSRLVKFEHTLFAMPFAMIGFFLGVTEHNSKLSWKLLILVILCMIFARNSAMGFNRFLDRKIDKLNPRTSKREIPSGAIKSKHALLFVIINSLLFIATTWFINQLCFFLSPIALFVILFYSYTKRFTALCHFILSLGLAIAPVGAYLAVTGIFNWIPIYIGTIVFFWVSGFDIIYALQDEDFDKENKLKSIPSLVGKKKALYIAASLHILSALVVICVGLVANLGWFYWLGALIFISLLIYQHTLVKPNDLSKVNLAFFTTNGIASVIYGVLVIGDLLFT